MLHSKETLGTQSWADDFGAWVCVEEGEGRWVMASAKDFAFPFLTWIPIGGRGATWVRRLRRPCGGAMVTRGSGQVSL